jgi:tetratricopeptide (TPR) repeat protein
MKKSFLFLAFSFAALIGMQAQEEGAKLAKKAGKDLVSFHIDPQGNKSKLTDARTKIDEAVKMADAQALVSTWITRGEIYNTLTQQAMLPRILNKTAPLPTENLAIEAYKAFSKAFGMAEKKADKQDILAGLKELENNLTIFAFDAYEKKDFASSHSSFVASLDAAKILTDNKETSILAKKEDMQNQVFLTGLTAQMAGNNDAALSFYEQVYAQGTDEVAVYQGIYQIKAAKGDNEAALKVLAEGRKKFPKEVSLLFDQINAYLKAGKTDELISNLKEGIELEPKNVDLYVTLGNVYENLLTKSKEAGNNDKAAEYESLSRSTYAKALELDPNNSTALYSLGAIPFNKAAVLTQEMNKISGEAPTTANFAKIEKINVEVKKLFEEALPYFKKAEGTDPDYKNTLIALREIFARLDNLELAEEFSKRLKVVDGGGKNAGSYFK